MRNRILLALGGLVALLVVVVAVASIIRDDGDEATPVTTTTTAPPEAEPESGPIAPLTGLAYTEAEAADRPAIAVKIDNLDLGDDRAAALPQAGLPLADIVFEELVEGNITRFVAVFHSMSPGERIGPVRSARTTDLQILPQFGRTLFAWSGGNEGVTAAVAEVESIIDLGAGRLPSAYRRDTSRRAPHNLYVDAASLWAHAPDEIVPPEPIFAYRDEADEPPEWARPATGLDIVWGPGSASSPVGWQWDEDLQLYRREQRGRPHLDESGDPILTQNVVVLITEYGQSPADTRSPEAHTIGEGEAFVFTDGTVVTGRWERPEPGVAAQLTGPDGERIALTPGRTWIELPRAGSVEIREQP